MTIKLTPFNVKLLQLTTQAARGLRQITNLDSFLGATKNFHPEGLFSNEIFGQSGDKQRMRRFAYIDIKIPILHPLIYRALGKLKRIYPEIMAGRQYAIWDEEQQDLVKSNPIDGGGTGYAFFMKYFDKISFPERLSDQRSLNIKLINRTRDVALNSRIIVAPAGFRDYVIIDEREEEDEVNKLYRRLLSSANSVNTEIFDSNNEMFDRVRFGMQITFNLIYEYYETIIRGKNKLILGHVMTRQVRDGTRNVLTTQNLDIKEAFAEGSPTTNSTGVGLFQFIKAFRPKCLYHVQNGFLQKVFRSPGAPARLVNVQTMKAEEVQLPMSFYDDWMTSEGIEKLFNLFGENERRSEPLMVGTYALGLIYNDGKVFKIFSDIDELPAGMDRTNVSLMTFSEFIYAHVFHVEAEVTCNVTRFPVTGFGSIYPSEPYLKVTTETRKLWPLDDDWQVDESRGIAREFPIRTEAHIDTMMPAPDKLSGLTADFDGDKGTLNGLYTDEGVAESKRVMRSRAFHIKTDGNVAHSLATDTVNYVLGSMTGDVEVTQEELSKFTQIYGQIHNAPQVRQPIVAAEELKEDLTGIPVKKPAPGQEGYHTPEGINTSVTHPVGEVDKEVVEQYKKYPELLKALDSYMSKPDMGLAPKLKELAEVSKTIETMPVKLRVMRGFEGEGSQENFGITSGKVGESASFRSEAKTISTTTSMPLARSYGSIVVEIELDDNDCFLVITDAMSVACAEQAGRGAGDCQNEVVILPPVAVTACVIENTPGFFNRDFGNATLTTKVSDSVSIVTSLEAYSEGINDTFESDGVKFDINKIFAMVGENPVMREIPISKMDWVLDFDIPDPVRVENADIAYPIIVTPFKMGTYLVVDGLHRMAQAKRDGITKLVAYVITAKQMQAARISS